MPPGGAWYQPTMRQADGEARESTCTAGLATAKGTSPQPLRWVPYITVFGRRTEVHLSAALFRGLLVAVVWLALWAALPRPLMELNGSVLDPLLAVLVSTVLGGSICHYFRLPSQIGILLVAILWGNIAGGYFTEGIVTELRFIASRMGLTVIVSRAGFAVNFKEIKKIWKNVVALSLLPMLTEALVHAMVAYVVMDYPDIRWCFIQGFVVSGIAPGVVVPPLLGLREEGFGHTGPTSLMLFSVVLDSLGSIWATSFFIDLIFSDLDLALSIALGPIQLIGGVILGIASAFVLQLVTKVFVSEVDAEDNETNTHTLKYPQPHLDHVHYKVFACYTAMAVSMVFLGDRANLAGGGAIGVLSLSATLSHLWAPSPHPPKIENPVTVVSEGRRSNASRVVGSPVEDEEQSHPPGDPTARPHVTINEPFDALERQHSHSRRMSSGGAPLRREPSFSASNTQYNVDGTHILMDSEDEEEGDGTLQRHNSQGRRRRRKSLGSSSFRKEGSFSASSNAYNLDGTHILLESEEDEEEEDEEEFEGVEVRCPPSPSHLNHPTTNSFNRDDRKQGDGGRSKRDSIATAPSSTFDDVFPPPLPNEEQLQAMVEKCENHFFPAERQRLFLDYAWLWDNIVMPSLFAGAGTAVDLYGTFDEDFFPKALLTLGAGVIARLIVAMVCSLGQGFSGKQILFVGIGWCGKAAVQAALGGAALAKAQTQSPADPAFIKAASEIQRTAMLAAIFMATLSGCAVVNLGRRWLPKKEV